MFKRLKVYNFGVKMPEEEFQRRAYVLGKEHSLDILRYLFSEGWSKSSDLANDLGIHIATASSYLEELHEVDLLDMREVQGKTRQVKEYRISDPNISLNLDLREEKKRDDSSVGFYSDLYDSVLNRTQTLYGRVPEEVKCDVSSIEDKNKIIKKTTDLLDHNKSKIGKQPTLRLLSRAGKGVVKEHRDDTDIEKNLADFPNDYRQVLEDEIR